MTGNIQNRKRMIGHEIMAADKEISDILKNSLVVQTWPIDKLVPYARNPRKNDEQVTRMISAIKEFGFRIPVVAKSDGTVVDGHLRLKAARQLGMTEVPVALADELTDAQVKAFRILANQSANWAEWDEDLLKLELDDLKELDFDLELTGFDLQELEALENVAGQVDSGDDNSVKGKLAELFGIPPFTVLSARDGWWQDRKRAWIALGIDSGQGRGESLLQFSDAARKAIHGKPYA